MKPDYKNWIPKGMMFSLIAGTALSLALLLVFGAFGIGVSGKLRVVLGVVFGVAFVVCAKYTQWCVYAVSFDGFDGTGETTYTTAQAQADKLAEYIEKELDGRLDLLYAESLGCGPAIFLKASPNIQIGRMILSGPEYLDFGVLNRLILKVMPQKQYRTAHEKYMPAWALRFMGQTEQGMQTMLRRIPDHISLESVRATWEAGLYLYRTDFPVQPDAKVACWYGEKEGHMKKAIQRLRKAYPGLIVRCFPGFGHGEIINHPALLASELERFLTDGGTERCAEESGK